MLTITEGLEITTVGRFGQSCANFRSGGTRFSMPVWSAKTYVAKYNHKKQLKWFYTGCFGRTVSGRQPSDKFVKEVMESCANFLPDIIHLKKIKGPVWEVATLP